VSSRAAVGRVGVPSAMMGTVGRRSWVWVFAEIEGLRWVLANKTMAFSRAAAGRVAGMGPGDRAVLYVARGAFHNPGRDRSHLAGLVEVAGEPAEGDPVEIAGRRYPVTVPIAPLVVLPERAGPPVAELAGRLSFVRRREAWGMYFRTSPLEVGPDDFAVLERAVRRAAVAAARR
jgi:hypothetical protein